MKSKFLTLLFCLLGWTCFAAIDIGVTHHTFKGKEKNYVEVNLFVVGSTVNFKRVKDSLQQANVEVLILIKKDTSIVQFEKYNLMSPLSKAALNFVDMKRFALDNGSYHLEVTVTDLNDKTQQSTRKAKIEMVYGLDQLYLSDIQLLGACEADDSENVFVKNGFRMETLPFSFYNRKMDKMRFYLEIYNSDPFIGDQFLVRYIVKRIDGNGEKKDVLLGNKKRLPKEVNTFLIQKSIAKLPSGNYELVVEICTKKNEILISKKVNFQRSNPTVVDDAIANLGKQDAFVDHLSAEELNYALRAIAPIIEDDGVERLNFVIASNDVKIQKTNLYGFWVTQNNTLPAEAYQQYMQVAKAVDKKFKSSYGHGFESDRGFIFMKYGKPDDVITVEDEPSAPPYEIWSYNDFPKTKQTNVKFIFYNPSLATGNFRTLHSTARGELNNPQWEVELYRDDPGSLRSTDFDSTTVPGGVARRARQYFQDF